MPRFCPRLEALENRSCPAAPVMSLAAAAAGNTMVTLSGVVQDEAPAGLWIWFSGAYTGCAETDSSGAFSVTITPDQAGTVFATVYDGEGYMGDAAVELQNAMPMIVDFVATPGTGNYWTFSGRVLDEACEGLEVTLWGCPSIDGLTVTVDANGEFSVSVQLEEGEGGYIYASVLDWWNQMGGSSLMLDTCA
jgi:hypothetical protein